jgi:dCMP deaminase
MARPNRPPFPQYFLEIAQTVAKRADCTRLQVGAVITQGDRIWTTGYNGPPESGQPGCLAGACPRGRFSIEEFPGYMQGNHDYSNCISVHAEINAIYQFEQIRRAVNNSRDGIGEFPHLWVTNEPCRSCKEVIEQSTILPHWPGHGYLTEVIDG